jgi:sugar phosphate isomerase/epimerase
MTTPRTPHDLRWPDLVWSHFSRSRFDDFDGRVKAAAAAGYAGIGLFVHAYQRMRDQGRSAANIAATVADHGLVLGEVELVRGFWATEGPVAEQCRELEQLAYELADAAGVRYLQVIGPYDCSLDQASEGFAGLCDRANEHGLKVGIEWLPFTNITTAADARAIVESADRPNGGYCADIWHHTRGANDLEMIRALDPDKIFAIQMSDGPMTQQLPDYKEDCLANRVPPGDGEFDCVGFMQTLFEMGVTAPISLEVCSTELWDAPVDEAARLGAEAMRRVLAQLTAA